MAGLRSKRNWKRVQPGEKTKRQGLAMIGKVVADMQHLSNPGPYGPQPIAITLQQSKQSGEPHGREILALTKLNSGRG